MTTAHDFAFKQLNGAAPVALKDFAGKVVLLVNVASACGLTPQYGPLEKLYEDRKAKGLVVLGAPCNDFGAQESGTEGEIGSFCETHFGVTFPMTEKVKVNGKNRHPLYAELVQAPDAHGMAGPVTWNFEKFLVLPSGEVHRFRPNVKPDAPEIVALIEANLPA